MKRKRTAPSRPVAGQRRRSPRGRPREFDADAALDRAMRVFWARGYDGASLADLTAAMEINRPSLYAAFGDKASLFRKALARYAEGPAAFLREALSEPTARAVAERILRGMVDQATCPQNPRGCLWVHGVMSCTGGGRANDPLHRELLTQQAATERELRNRFERAIAEGDLPGSADAGALARFISTVNFGMSIHAAAGATRKQLMEVVKTALKAWPGS